MEIPEKLLELINKLKALSDEGIGGEKINAQKMLEKVMDDNGITMEDIAETEHVQNTLHCDDKQRRIMGQIIVHVMGKTIKMYGSNMVSGYIIHCTKAQFVEIISKFEFYWAQYEEELELFTSAFVYKHQLLPPDATEAKAEDLDMKKMEKLKGMMDILDNKSMVKMLK